MPEPITPAPQPTEAAQLAAMLIQEAVVLDSLCNKIINGECRTLACLQRGGHVRGVKPPDPSVATCLELEEATAMRRAAALLQQQATPAMESARLNELADRLGWIAAQLSDIGWGDDSASVAQASDLIRRQASPARPAPVEAPGDFEIGEWIESLPSWPDGWLATPLSELVCLVSAAFDRWPLSIPTDHEPPAPAAASPATMGASAARPDAPLTTEVSPP